MKNGNMLREFNAHLSEIPSTKISMLRAVVSDTKKEIHKKLSSNEKRKIKRKKYMLLGESDSNNILLNMQRDSIDLNNGKSKNLKNFIKSYLLSLNTIDLESLIVKLEYYASFFTVLGIKSPETKASKDLIRMCENFKSENIEKFIYTLIINNVILPDTVNQKQFDSELSGILARLDYATINKLLFSISQSPLVFRPVNSNFIIDTIYEKGVYSCYGNKELKGDVLTNFGFSITVGSSSNFQFEDRVNLEFVFTSHSNGKGVDRSGLEIALKSGFAPLGADSYLLGATEHLLICGTISELYIDSPLAEKSEEKQKVRLDIWSKARHSTMKIDDYLTKSFNSLPAVSEGILSGLYVGNKDLLDNEFLKRDIVDITALARFPELDEDGEESFASDKLLKLGEEKKNKNVIGEIDLKSLNYKNLILTDDLNDLIDEFVDNINNLEEYKKHGIGLPRGLLLYGQGGGGKTSICQNIVLNANNKKKKFYKLNIEQLLNAYVGQSEKHAKQFIDDMRKDVADGYLVFCLIDEVDGLMSNGTGTDVLSGTRSVILQELDGVTSNNDGIVFLSTTNYIEKLSAPFIRRFGTKAEIKAPDKSTLNKLFDLYIEKHFSGYEINLNISKLIDKANGKTSGFVEAWVKTAVKYFIHKRLSVLDNEVFLKTFERAEFEMSEEKGRKMGFGQQ